MKFINIFLKTYRIFLLYYLYNFFHNRRSNCPSCKSNNFFLFFRKRYHLKNLTLEKCKKCDLVFQNPNLNEKGLNFFYKYFYRLDYIFKNYNNLFYRENRRGNYIINYFSDITFELKEKRIFEIGAGCGGILFQFKNKFNCRVYGIDLDEKTVSYGKKQGICLDTTSFENFSKIQNFDVIIISHVLEHVVDLDYFFKKLKSIMSNETYVYIEVPGIDNPKVIQRNYSLQPGHLSYFSESTLKNILNKFSLKILKSNSKIQMICKNG